ncbi:hypothetical protein M9H77_30921 [Catharanthus roseus]|uniref:Uncharacterized protein n=1 Tax=Catharanthus roseus TaxID=4058 RepID=A0ACB9ZZF8_CATRO|nr:hypothetical protein M9H77_30921 [Catharanthus roseus]
MGVRLFGNRALICCLAGIDYKMTELGSYDLVLGIRTFLVPRGIQISYSAAVDLDLSFPKVLVAKLGKSSSSHYWVYGAWFSISSLVECLNCKIFNRSSSTRS